MQPLVSDEHGDLIDNKAAYREEEEYDKYALFPLAVIEFKYESGVRPETEYS